MTNLYLDINVLQTVPPANLNRDDTGSPKTAVYGGAVRARVSSQSWKRAMRKYFKENGRLIATRTKKVPTILAAKLQELQPELTPDEAMAKSKQVLEKISIKKFDDNDDTKVLLAVSPGQLTKLAEYALNHDEAEWDKKAIKQILKGDQSLDLALFGRMVADDPELNVEATAQVAHALSTNEITPEFDYYTAIDDLKPDDSAGASMLGDIEYNSSTLYRYANVNVRELITDLGTEDALQGVIDFIKSFVLSMPTGKQNSFANKTLPSYVMIAVRPDTPVNLVSAFEAPIQAKAGYMVNSIKRLEKEYQNTLDFVEQPLAQVILTNETPMNDQHVENLTALLDQVAGVLKEAVENEDDNA